MTRRKSAYSGFTVTEFVVVFGIIVLLLGLLFPVVLSSRQSARDTVCKNNIRQLGIGLEQLRGPRPNLPIWNVDVDTAGGWSVAVLPFVDPVYVDRLDAGTGFDLVDADSRRRPSVFTCPLATDETNEWGIGRTHYALSARPDRRNWFVIDAQNDEKTPWLAGFEIPQSILGVGPHRGGFYQYWRNGQLNFVPPNSNGDRQLTVLRSSSPRRLSPDNKSVNRSRIGSAGWSLIHL